MAAGSRSLRVLHVAGSFPIPPFGGMEAVTYFLPIELSKQGAQVKLISGTPHPRREKVAEAEFRGVKSFRLSSWVRVPSWSGVEEIRRELAWADVVHVHNPPEFVPFTAGWRSLRIGKPTIFSVLSPGNLHRHPRPLFRLVGSIDDFMVGHLLRNATLVHVKNRIDFETMAAITHRVSNIPDGIESEFFEPLSSSCPSLMECKTSTSYPIVSYIGRIHPYKGPYDFVEMLGLLRRSYPSLLGVVAGTGPAKEISNLRSFIGALGLTASVRLVGPLSTAQKISLIDASNVVVVPSKADFVEGFSIVCSEAWARRRPVAAYPVGALRARVVDGDNGYLAERIDPSALADAVTKALTLSITTIPHDVMPWSNVARTFFALYQSLL